MVIFYRTIVFKWLLIWPISTILAFLAIYSNHSKSFHWCFTNSTTLYRISPHSNNTKWSPRPPLPNEKALSIHHTQKTFLTPNHVFSADEILQFLGSNMCNRSVTEPNGNSSNAKTKNSIPIEYFRINKIPTMAGVRNYFNLVAMLNIDYINVIAAARILVYWIAYFLYFLPFCLHNCYFWYMANDCAWNERMTCSTFSRFSWFLSHSTPYIPIKI